MSRGNLRRNVFNRRRPVRPNLLSSLSSSSSLAASAPAITNRPPTELLVGGVYILVTVRGDDRDSDRGASAISPSAPGEKGTETPLLTEKEEEGGASKLSWSLYVQRTQHLGAIYDRARPPRAVFSIAPRARSQVAPGRRLVGMVQVDCLPAWTSSFDERICQAVGATATASNTVEEEEEDDDDDDDDDDERSWVLGVLRALGNSRRRTPPNPNPSSSSSSEDLVEAVGSWAAKAARDAREGEEEREEEETTARALCAAPVAFWWREDWRWEVPAGVPRGWKDLAYRSGGKNYGGAGE